MNARVAVEQLVPTLDGFALPTWPRDAAPAQLMPVLAELFCRDPKRQQATLNLPPIDDDEAAHAFIARAVREGVIDSAVRDDAALRLTVSRASFWQQPSLWLAAPSSAGMPVRYAVDHNRRHPVRAPKPGGVVYRRFMPTVDMTFSLRTVDVARDTDVFHQWQNLDRVAHFWDFKGTREQHAAYLAEQCADPHVHPLIGSFDDEPFAYFEVYWAKEDRIAPYYDAHDFDRGLHLLVGNSEYQSAGKLRAWFNGILHYMFLDDPRTQRIVGEPRVDHTRHIAWMHRLGAYTLKEFDFPHKRAALVMVERETYFGQFGP
jgi:acetyl CoA:N6-hydroxylysine acetyl transferase